MAVERAAVRRASAAARVVTTSCLALALITCGKRETPTAAPTPLPKPTPGPCVVRCSAGSRWFHLAIAYSPSARVCAWAEGYTTQDAKDRSVSACGRADCLPVVWGFSGVAAVAANDVAYGWGWERHVSSLAEAEAIAHCESRTR